MTDTTYNGWTNYATWRVRLEMFDGSTSEDVTGERTRDVHELRERLKDYAEELIEQGSQPGLARDYAYAFLSEVNWYEIAEHMIDDEQENDEYEEA